MKYQCNDCFLITIYTFCCLGLNLLCIIIGLSDVDRCYDFCPPEQVFLTIHGRDIYCLDHNGTTFKYVNRDPILDHKCYWLGILTPMIIFNIVLIIMCISFTLISICKECVFVRIMEIHRDYDD